MPSPAKPSIFPGRNAGHAPECPVEIRNISESAVESNFGGGFLCVQQLLTGRLDSYLVQVFNCGYSGGLTE